MAIFPTQSAVDSLVDYLEGLSLGLSKILRGFPEHVSSLELGNGPPALSIHALPNSETWDYCTPSVVDTRVELGTKFYTYKIAYLTLDIQMDLWAPYRVQRDTFALAVQEALHSDPAIKSGLWLDQINYHGRPLSFDVISSGQLSSQNSATRGEWRHMWKIEVSTDFIMETTGVDIGQVILQAQSTLNNQTTTYDDYTI